VRGVADQAGLDACRGFVESQLLSLLLALEPTHRLRPHALAAPTPALAWADAELPILRVYLAEVADLRPPRRAALRLVEQLAAWPDRPSAAELRVELAAL
jgi:hypothetical protein